MQNPQSRRSILRALTAGFVAGAVPARSASASPSAEIATGITLAENARLDRQPFGDLHLYLDGHTEQLSGLTVGSLQLKPGQAPHPPHRHAEEEVMVITEGKGEISLEGKVTRVSPGAMMYAGSNRLHGIVNTGKTPLMFYYFKWVGK